ncbi:putative Meiotic coiled-coil protein 2 [Sclerotinia borealis F-4128]|uniref:Putative Meiotic coiled-coil protein 2 n=1 Tax=Sclerotinia borealis (strain F-4128) TaxID=1432307 RepID=W9CA95_SCLBF|nr:putative Meiotic coiled-coil protein 2 [Sclerotinia borealis F-4128]
MASSVASNGSPTLRRTMDRCHENSGLVVDDVVDKMSARMDTANTLKKAATALSTNKLGNQAAPKKMKLSHDTYIAPATAATSCPSSSFDNMPNPVDKLLAKLSEQQAVLNRQHEALRNSDDYGSGISRTIDYNSAPTSVPITPATETFDSGTATTAPTTRPHSRGDGDNQPSAEEVLRLKIELEAAKGRIARMDQELAQNRITKHTIDQAIGSVSEADFPLGNVLDNAAGIPPNHFRPQVARESSWATQEDAHSDHSDALSASGYNRTRAIWGNNKPNFPNAPPMPSFQPSDPHTTGQWMGRGGCSQPFVESNTSFGGPPPNSFRGERYEHDMNMPGGGVRRNNGSRFNNRNLGSIPYSSSSSSFDGFTPSSSSYGSMGGVPTPLGSQMNMGMNVGSGMYSGYQPQPIGTPLSPHAPEFTSSSGTWKAESVANEGHQTYLPTTEPLNYRRLLDRTVNCNWKYIVDKIVCNNDQQASIFLQQKLKVGTTEQKYDIVEAIVAQAYPLMVNRFGNFLVQRCFEHGTPEQVIKIAEAIRGNTLNLSMDAFGCHVVQKAFDSVPEDYKAIMVHELLRRIPETVIHRYACHVWQKLFELRWTESPPQIMKYVNEALRGMWHEVALGETGSLVVQNIFENCLEEDKRPCIEEVLASIDIVAHGQFGNWCIQHICEHGAPADRSRAIDHVIRYASEYSMDQFASKVVEKCLKIGGVDFLGRYLDRVCEGRLDRPRIPLIDIASDQYGNYLIQYILQHSNPQHREIVASHIRKHMVSLRGSKFGSRVGMLCTNPALQTRPGPGAGPTISSAPPPRMPPSNVRYGGAYR